MSQSIIAEPPADSDPMLAKSDSRQRPRVLVVEDTPFGFLYEKP